MEENKPEQNVEEKITETNIEENVPEIEQVQSENTQKENKSKNKFIIKYIIFVVIMVLITVIGIFFTIKYIDKSSNDEQIVEEENDTVINEEKKIAEDSKYAIKSYSETYDMNSLEIKEYYDIDGQITQENRYSDYKTKISFIQIDGLKNKDIQNKINAKLKNVPYSLEKEEDVYTYVGANFSNVLSVGIYSDKQERKTLNFDLTTGNEILFEDLFVSSTPIKSILASVMYEDFAWGKLYEDYEKYEGFYDMKDADTSEIEDQILLTVSRYDKIKDEILFSFTPISVTIYNKDLECTIDTLKCMKEIAIYKRYLTEESIFEDDSIGTKGIIVFTEDRTQHRESYARNISYGKISNNLFIEELLLSFEELEEQEFNMVTEYVKKLSKEQQEILKQETPSNKGVIHQGEYIVSKYNEKGYYHIWVNSSKSECLISYFEEQAFKDYIEVNNLPRVEVGLNMFSSYMQDDYPEMQITDMEQREYYLSFTGEFLGNTEEEANSKIWE